MARLGHRDFLRPSGFAACVHEAVHTADFGAELVKAVKRFSRKCCRRAWGNDPDASFGKRLDVPLGAGTPSKAFYRLER